MELRHAESKKVMVIVSIREKADKKDNVHIFPIVQLLPAIHSVNWLSIDWEKRACIVCLLSGRVSKHIDLNLTPSGRRKSHLNEDMNDAVVWTIAFSFLPVLLELMPHLFQIPGHLGAYHSNPIPACESNLA